MPVHDEKLDDTVIITVVVMVIMEHHGT